MYSRRHFINTTTLTALGLATHPVLRFDDAAASGPSALTFGITEERVAATAASLYRPYCSRVADSPDVTTWAQVDLGSSQPIDAVRLYPFTDAKIPAGEGFPLQFRVECSDDPNFETSQSIVDYSKTDYPDPNNHVVQFGAKKVQGRYVRVTATRLRAEKPTTIVDPLRWAREMPHMFALTKIEVISGAVDIALRQPVTVDAVLGNPSDAQQLTRALRPQGEGLTTDNPKNVTHPDMWRPPRDRARAPVEGVRIHDGIFRDAVLSNISYLLDSYSVDDLLYPFRQRAGKSVSPLAEPSIWDRLLPGSSAGRFLMGAANTLHWIDHPELRRRVVAVVDGIAECRQPDGYIMAYPEHTFFNSEHGAYTRAWVTHGLIDAGYVGNEKAFELLRGYYDWYNAMPHLPEALRRCSHGGQGMVANARMYFSPVGKPADLQVLQRYFQENYWLSALAARNVDAIWQYPYDRPHSYLLTNLEAYLDLYRATGNDLYLNAIKGAWELFRGYWQNVGGSISIIEHENCPPGSNLLQTHLGETCGSAFWVLLNQRLHLLDPDEERYVTEIEKSIYNVLLANQDGSRGIRYHTVLVGHKDKPTCRNTCCEGQGTRLLASLPQFIYSLADDGVYVNLFEPSSIAWDQAGAQMRLEMQAQFPSSPQVLLQVHATKPVRAKIRVRVPSWATGVMNIEVNGTRVGTGNPGCYVTIDRVWSSHDRISFTLPLDFKLTEYTGSDQVQGRKRYALEYGPILMAALGAADAKLELSRASSPKDMLTRLRPVAGRPLHFVLSDPLTDLLARAISESETEFCPYFEIGAETFSCFPVVEVKATLF
jgi:uncharacterized protein